MRHSYPMGSTIPMPRPDAEQAGSEHERESSRSLRAVSCRFARPPPKHVQIEGTRQISTTAEGEHGTKIIFVHPSSIHPLPLSRHVAAALWLQSGGAMLLFRHLGEQTFQGRGAVCRVSSFRRTGRSIWPHPIPLQSSDTCYFSCVDLALLAPLRSSHLVPGADHSTVSQADLLPASGIRPPCMFRGTPIKPAKPVSACFRNSPDLDRPILDAIRGDEHLAMPADFSDLQLACDPSVIGRSLRPRHTCRLA